tara:strand:+ start:7900 stop:8553 length:654 start_codon:yes stop_codon:yes gene_type:complete
MGARARGFANGLSSGGKLLPSVITNTNIANFTSSPSGLASAGSMTKLTHADVSGETTIDFSFTGTYKEYMFVASNCRPSATSEPDFKFNCSSDGTNFNLAAQSSVNRTGSSSSQELHQIYNLPGHAGSTTGMFWGFDMEGANQADTAGSMVLHIYDPHSTGIGTSFIYESCAVHDAVRADHYRVGGYWETTAALTKIRFFRDTGTYTDGLITMYGLS